MNNDHKIENHLVLPYADDDAVSVTIDGYYNFGQLPNEWANEAFADQLYMLRHDGNTHLSHIINLTLQADENDMESLQKLWRALVQVATEVGSSDRAQDELGPIMFRRQA